MPKGHLQLICTFATFCKMARNLFRAKLFQNRWNLKFLGRKKIESRFFSSAILRKNSEYHLICKIKWTLTLRNKKCSNGNWQHWVFPIPILSTLLVRIKVIICSSATNYQIINFFLQMKVSFKMWSSGWKIKKSDVIK